MVKCYEKFRQRLLSAEEVFFVWQGSQTQEDTNDCIVYSRTSSCLWFSHQRVYIVN